MSFAGEIGSAPLPKRALRLRSHRSLPAAAMPPFGNLYGMTVYVDESLTKDKDIAFNAGTHDELLQVSYADLARLATPTVLKFAELPDLESMGAWHL